MRTLACSNLCQACDRSASSNCNIVEAERFMAQYGRLFEFIKDELLTGGQYRRCLENPATYRHAVSYCSGLFGPRPPGGGSPRLTEIEIRVDQDLAASPEGPPDPELERIAPLR